MEIRHRKHVLFLDCQKYQCQGAKNLILSQTYGKDQIRYLRCTECQPQFSARKGSALFNRQIRASKAASIIDLVNCGHGVVDSAELTHVCKDRVSGLVGGVAKSVRCCTTRTYRM